MKKVSLLFTGLILITYAISLPTKTIPSSIKPLHPFPDAPIRGIGIFPSMGQEENTECFVENSVSFFIEQQAAPLLVSANILFDTRKFLIEKGNETFLDNWLAFKASEHFFLLIPKTYLTDIKATSTDKVGAFTKREIILGLKIDHPSPAVIKDIKREVAPISMTSQFFIEIKRGEPRTLLTPFANEFFECLQNIFMTHKDYTEEIIEKKFKEPVWLIYLNDHGDYRRTPKDAQQLFDYKYAQYIATGIDQKAREAIGKAGFKGIIAGFYISDFKKLLNFFNNKIFTYLFIFNTCYGADINVLEATRSDRKDLLGETYNYPIMSLTSTSTPTSAFTTATFSPNFKEFFNNPKKYSFFNLIGTIAPLYTDYDVWAEAANPDDQIYLLERFSHIPSIRFPGREWMSLLESPEGCMVKIGKVLAKSHGRDLNVRDFFAQSQEKIKKGIKTGQKMLPAVITLEAAEIPFKLIIPRPTGAKIPPHFISLIPRTAVHHIKEINAKDWKFSEIVPESFQMIMTGEDKVFIIDTLVTKDFKGQFTFLNLKESHYPAEIDTTTGKEKEMDYSKHYVYQKENELPTDPGNALNTLKKAKLAQLLKDIKADLLPPEEQSILNTSISRIKELVKAELSPKERYEQLIMHKLANSLAQIAQPMKS
ncbi:MAG: hypothetical protein JW725_02515 [Candidatus Babeliaceae bacterium]|nr:hypothetical protein [Candidatus Babeliaceae bacterium]